MELVTGTNAQDPSAIDRDPKIDLVLVKGNKKRGKGNGNEKGKEKKKKSEKEIESESMREKGGNAQETGKGNEIGGIKVQKIRLSNVVSFMTDTFQCASFNSRFWLNSFCIMDIKISSMAGHE